MYLCPDMYKNAATQGGWEYSRFRHPGSEESLNMLKNNVFLQKCVDSIYGNIPTLPRCVKNRPSRKRLDFFSSVFCKESMLGWGPVVGRPERNPEGWECPPPPAPSPLPKHSGQACTFGSVCVWRVTFPPPRVAGWVQNLSCHICVYI